MLPASPALAFRLLVRSLTALRCARCGEFVPLDLHQLSELLVHLDRSTVRRLRRQSPYGD